MPDVFAINNLFEKRVQDAIAEHVRLSGEKAIKNAVADFEAKVRKAVSQAAVSVASNIDYARDRNGLAITVRFPPSEK